jgi:hypothetical protein
MKPSMFIKVALFVLLASLPRAAFAQCVTPFEQGNWTNDDSATGGITRVLVTFSCNDQILCGVDANGNVTCSKPGAPFRLHLWGKCHPSDCDWGAVDGNEVTIGGRRWIYSYFDQGFARRHVYITPSPTIPGELFLWM